MAAKKRYGHPGVVEFEVMDAFDIPSLMKLEKSMGKRFNKV